MSADKKRTNQAESFGHKEKRLLHNSDVVNMNWGKRDEVLELVSAGGSKKTQHGGRGKGKKEIT